MNNVSREADISLRVVEEPSVADEEDEAFEDPQRPDGQHSAVGAGAAATPGSARKRKWLAFDDGDGSGSLSVEQRRGAIDGDNATPEVRRRESDSGRESTGSLLQGLAGRESDAAGLSLMAQQQNASPDGLPQPMELEMEHLGGGPHRPWRQRARTA